MRRLDIRLDELVDGAADRLHRKQGGLADVAAVKHLELDLLDRGQCAHIVCPGCNLDMPSDMVVWMQDRSAWMCTGCLDGLYRQGVKPDGSRYTRREIVELAGGEVSDSGDFWDQPARQVVQVRKEPVA